MIEHSDDSDRTLVYRRSDFDDSSAGRFPEDLRGWQSAVRLIRLVQEEVGNLPSETTPTPEARTLAAILLWCLATGRYASWDIEALCEEEPLTRHLAAGLSPAYADIRRFRRDHEGELTAALARLFRAACPAGITPSPSPSETAAEAARRYERARYADTEARD